MHPSITQWQNTKLQNVTDSQLLSAYNTLNPTDYNAGNKLFEDFGPGNLTSPIMPYLNVINRPYERLAVYEHILYTLKNADRAKYATMHKGTAYFFLSWLAFTIRDFEKAVFYMDAAISEDLRAASHINDITSWKNTPAAKFFLLDPNQNGVAAKSIIYEITSEFQNQLNKFNQKAVTTLSINIFRDNFIIPKIQDGSARSIISGIYVFMMEYKERASMISFKSSEGGSIKPFMTHLFSGCLVFESLMKAKYQDKATSKTLGGYLKAGLQDLELGQGNYSKPLYQRDQQEGYTFERVIDLLPTWRNEDYKERLIAIIFGVRNTAGHDLSWPVTFDETTYEDLYEAIIQSIFWCIWKFFV